MIVVTVARKPFAESTAAKNTLALHTGGINIDACRIGEGDGHVPAGPSIPNFKNQVYGHGFGGGRCDTSKGRFPANLILGHLPECHLVGEKTVKSDTHYPASRSAGAGMGMLGHTGQEGLLETRQKEETVSDWECAEGCPVAALDGHSGISKSSGFGGRVITKRSSSKDKNGNSGYAYGEESRPDGTEMTTYGDEGGASRYFKQVKS